MGLAERRAAKDFQDNDLPGLTVQIFQAIGFEVPIDIRWPELSVDGAAENYKSWWTDIYFKTLLSALGQIARDDMGKEALKAGLKSIELRNSANLYVPSESISFEAGVLTIDHGLTNVEDVASRSAYMVELVESKL